MNKPNIFINLLKEYTNIDHDFIDTFFTKFKIGGELDFHIKDVDAAKYLGIKLYTLRKRLLNTFSKNENYIENVDYIKIKSDGKTTSKSYVLNYQCFERLAMAGDSVKSESVRMYFIKLRQFITEHHRIIYQSLNNFQELNLLTGVEAIYFFAIDDRKRDIFKIGRTKDIIQRLRNYNVGRIKEVELKYLAIVTKSIIIENCMKFKLKKYQVLENKEIYKVDPKKLKKVINDCYCKNVSKTENENLYKELGELLSLYGYVKNKIHIKPYIIIDK